MKTMPVDDFFNKYSDRLVKVTEDNAEYGDYLALHPEELDLVKDYISKGHQIVSVHEAEDGDFVDMSTPCNIDDDPSKYGYYIFELAENLPKEKEVIQ